MPYFYNLNADGSIKDLTNTTALSIMRQAGVRIVPMITNVARWDDFHNAMASPDQRNAAAQRIADLVTSNNYEGIHIDFEAVNASDAPLLTDFMRRLADKLHPKNKLVTQAVIARTSDTPTTWGGAYDYAALAGINDYIAIMAYDYHPQGSATPGAIAPITWQRNVLRYAKTRIPAANILLGMPLYGYDWDLTDGPPATALRYEQAAALAARPGATTGYDKDQEQPWLRYTDDDGHPHEAWYENAESMRAKLNLMIDEGVGGFALWRLGQEDPAVWEEIARLNTPATRIAPFPSSADRIYFKETGHSLSFGFKTFWNQSGGLPVFGYPLTEEFSEQNQDNGKTYTVQYFERQRFEYHPEHRLTHYETELGRLGAADAAERDLLNSSSFQPLPAGTGSNANCTFVRETGHRLCGGFRSYWQSHGLEFNDLGISYRESLALFGYPISEEFTDPATGLVTQYFERARFEYHPENAAPYDILLGRLGADTVRAKGWIR
jgi:GH18 family chitinase